MAFPWDVLGWLAKARYKITALALSDGETAELQCDSKGHLKVRIISEGDPAVAASRQLTAAKKGTLKASAGSLVEVAIWNKSAVALWFQVHNKASDPVDTEACVDQVMVPAGATIGWRPVVPVACATQVRWAASTTPGTLTLPATDDVGCSAAVL